MICTSCGKKPAVKGVLCKDCSKQSTKLTPEQYQEALRRFRLYIVTGGEEWHFDDTTIGSKDTQASWGLCCSSPEMWPDPQSHLWPHQFVRHGRSAPKYRKKGQNCPMDKDQSADPMGCFYRCRIFQGPRPDREEAIKLYDLSLERLVQSK